MPKFLSTKDFNKSVLDSRKLLKALDLDDRRSHYPNQLSGGEQQRVAVARSLINSPEIIFADEPTGNLDSKHSDELIDLLINLNKKHGQTFVIATHNKDIANKMDRCFNLKDGILSEIKQ
jgi:lipoprotein-releasing system ATP-binding protein